MPCYFIPYKALKCTHLTQWKSLWDGDLLAHKKCDLKLLCSRLGISRLEDIRYKMRKKDYLTALIRRSSYKAFSCLVFLVHFLVFLERMLQLRCSRGQKSALNWAHKKIADRKSISSQRYCGFGTLLSNCKSSVLFYVFIHSWSDVPGNQKAVPSRMSISPGRGTGSQDISLIWAWFWINLKFLTFSGC